MARARALPRPLQGATAVARALVAFYGQAERWGVALVPARVNGQPGFRAVDRDGRLVTVAGLDIAGGRVQRVHSIVNPDKLGHLGEVSDLALRPPPAVKSQFGTIPRRSVCRHGSIIRGRGTKPTAHHSCIPRPIRRTADRAARGPPARPGDFAQLLAAGLDTERSRDAWRGTAAPGGAACLCRWPRGALWGGHYLAAVLEAGEGAALSHLAAAELWEARKYRASVIDVVVPEGAA